ncbi:hypothetical protein ALI144C_05690 [Actinosynnema sp. ALI-1.44]|uniref:hypothetical protein n=1 Tax=Actinosynnema sp. ALI-1.44 TaxID=1933779 RepID=UPI00097BB563|nr:hypothetical protein [Actinosynnema sp. ALI-1.44]ONI88993.1 hypothetical protein ALI144C_05690 [Actinosynnema sp. ALI-1.44]
MSSLTAESLVGANHPAGQIMSSSRRDIAARVNALAGYRMDLFPGRSAVSRIEAHTFTLTAES